MVKEGFLEVYYSLIRKFGKYMIGIPVMIAICFLGVYIDIIYDAGTFIAEGIISISEEKPRRK